MLILKWFLFLVLHRNIREISVKIFVKILFIELLS